MAKEYKFMFDRRFDDPTEFVVDATDSDPLSNILKTVENIIDMQTSDPDAFEKSAQSDASKTQETSFDPENTDLPNDAAVEEKAPPVIVYTQTELDAAVAAAVENATKEAYEVGKKDGYDSGFKDGRDKGCAETRATLAKEYDESNETRQAQAAADIAKAAVGIAEKYAAEESAVFQNAVEIAAAVCRKAVPAFCSKHGTEEIVSFLQDAFRFLKDEPKVTLHLHPDMTKGLKQRLEQIVAKESFGGKIAVVRDDGLQAGDCLIEWKNGSIERKIQDVLKRTDDLLKSYADTSAQNNANKAEQGE